MDNIKVNKKKEVKQDVRKGKKNFRITFRNCSKDSRYEERTSFVDCGGHEHCKGRPGENGREDCVESEVSEMESFDIQMVTGIFSGEKLDELTKFIINKFAEEKLNRDEAVEVLKRLEDVIGECSVVQHIADSEVAPISLAKWTYPTSVLSGHIDVSSVSTILRKLAKRAGVEHANPHKFRRTCATMALRRGMPIEQVSKMLGHEDVSTTQIYLDLSEDDLKQAHKKYVV